MEEESDNEERILLSKEYQKHLEEIEKASTREEHFFYKNIGYTECLENYEREILSVLFGYILESEISCDDFIDMLSKKMSEKKVDVLSLIENITKRRVQTVEEIENILREEYNK